MRRDRRTRHRLRLGIMERNSTSSFRGLENSARDREPLSGVCSRGAHSRTMRTIHSVLFCTVLALSIAAAPKAANVVINVDTKMEPPDWAVLERRVLETSAPAMAEFYHKYYDENGNVQCVVPWGADDGPDDAFENFAGWPEFHAIG